MYCTIEGIISALQSFFCGKTTLVESGIDPLLALITHKSAKSGLCSCEQDGLVKESFLVPSKTGRQSWEGCVLDLSSGSCVDNAA